MKVSICIPVYNVAPNILEETINSALNQTYSNIEIIVNDDCSETNYYKELKPLFSKNSIIKYYRNKKNIGMVNNWNETVKKSSGELVLLLGQDDIIDNLMVENYVKEFDKHSEVVLCSSSRVFINEKGEIIKPKRFMNDRKNIFIKKEKYILDYKEVTKLCLLNGNIIGEPSCVMYRKSAFEEIGGYDPMFKHAADLDFNLRIAQKGSIVYFNKPFLKRRLHKENLTNYNFLKGIVTKERSLIFEKFTKNDLFSKDEISEFKAFLVLSGIHDIIRLVKLREFKIIPFVIKYILKYIEMKPSIYFSLIKQILRGDNKYAK